MNTHNINGVQTRTCSLLVCRLCDYDNYGSFLATWTFLEHVIVQIVREIVERGKKEASNTHICITGWE